MVRIPKVKINTKVFFILAVIILIAIDLASSIGSKSIVSAIGNYQPKTYEKIEYHYPTIDDIQNNYKE